MEQQLMLSCIQTEWSPNLRRKTEKIIDQSANLPDLVSSDSFSISEANIVALLNQEMRMKIVLKTEETVVYVCCT